MFFSFQFQFLFFSCIQTDPKYALTNYVSTDQLSIRAMLGIVDTYVIFCQFLNTEKKRIQIYYVIHLVWQFLKLL